MTAAASDLKYTVLDFGALDGWAQDDHAAALTTFRNTCRDMDDPDWRSLCALAGDVPDARAFFELFFRPVLIEDGAPALFTGYFEPELEGSRRRSARYRFPVYAMPPEARHIRPWLTRRQILEGPVMQGRGLEIAWVDDPVELFFLQIQGSGRIRLSNGQMMRVGFGGANGHKYRSIGAELVRRGTFASHQVSAQVIRNYVRNNPVVGEELLYHNPILCVFSRSERSAGRSRTIGGHEPVHHDNAVHSGRSGLCSFGGSGLDRKRRERTLATIDDRAGYWVGHQGSTACRCVLWHRGQGGPRGWPFEGPRPDDGVDANPTCLCPVA